MEQEIKGWEDGKWDFDFQDAWDCNLEICILYEGNRYVISLEPEKCVYEDWKPYNIIKRYESKEDFYNSTLFGRPIREVLNDAEFIWIG